MGFVGDTGRNLISMVSESDGENTKGESNKEGNGDGFDGERARNWDAGEGSSRQPEMSVSSRQSTAEDDQKENTEADRSARNGSRSAERDERREQRAKQKRQLRAYTALRSAPPIPPSLVEVPASGTALLCRPQGGTWPTWPVISESVDSESLTEEQRKSFEEACAEQQEDTQEPIEVEDILVPLWFFSEHLDFTFGWSPLHELFPYPEASDPSQTSSANGRSNARPQVSHSKVSVGSVLARALDAALELDLDIPEHPATYVRKRDKLIIRADNWVKSNSVISADAAKASSTRGGYLGRGSSRGSRGRRGSKRGRQPKKPQPRLWDEALLSSDEESTSHVAQRTVRAPSSVSDKNSRHRTSHSRSASPLPGETVFVESSDDDSDRDGKSDPVKPLVQNVTAPDMSESESPDEELLLPRKTARAPRVSHSTGRRRGRRKATSYGRAPKLEDCDVAEAPREPQQEVIDVDASDTEQNAAELPRGEAGPVNVPRDVGVVVVSDTDDDEHILRRANSWDNDMTHLKTAYEDIAIEQAQGYESDVGDEDSFEVRGQQDVDRDEHPEMEFEREHGEARESLSSMGTDNNLQGVEAETRWDGLAQEARLASDSDETRNLAQERRACGDASDVLPNVDNNPDTAPSMEPMEPKSGQADHNNVETVDDNQSHVESYESQSDRPVRKRRRGPNSSPASSDTAKRMRRSSGSATSASGTSPKHRDESALRLDAEDNVPKSSRGTRLVPASYASRRHFLDEGPPNDSSWPQSRPTNSNQLNEHGGSPPDSVEARASFAEPEVVMDRDPVTQTYVEGRGVESTSPDNPSNSSLNGLSNPQPASVTRSSVASRVLAKLKAVRDDVERLEANLFRDHLAVDKSCV